jgi:hypothetical protein
MTVTATAAGDATVDVSRASEAVRSAGHSRGAHQEALTIIATVKGGHRDALDRLLGTIAGHVDDWAVIPFGKLGRVHFARVVLFDEASDLQGRRLPAQLALMTNVDAPLDAHLTDLATVCGPGLDEVFGHCEGYPAMAARSPAEREGFLRRHSVRSRAFYVNRPGRTVGQVLEEERLRRAINDHLDSADFSGQSSTAVRQAILDFVSGRPDLRWALIPAAAPSLAWRLREVVHAVLNVLLALLLAPVLVLVLPLFVIVLRTREKRDRPDTSQAAPEAVARFRADEDYWVQNQITAAGLFKPGWFRWLTATVILRATDFAIRHIYNRGFLAGLNTIHFARWVPLDGGRRLFFTSNYDGSLESYMNDFIDKAAWGLNAIFSSGDGFPRTSFLFCGGITDEKAYKRFLPTRQVHSRVWYSAYPHLTTKNLANNAEIRRGLSLRLDADETKAWLARFGIGNQLPPSGRIARLLDSIPWERLCRTCR